MLLLTPLILAAQPAPQCKVELFLGDPEFSTGDGGPALNAKFVDLGAIAAANDGTIYVADYAAYRIRKISPQGIVTTIAGTGQQGTSGDGGLAVQAQVAGPSMLTVAPNGALYFIDDGRYLRRITPTGTMETLYSQQTGQIRGVLATAEGSVYFTASAPSFGYVSSIVAGLYRLESNGSRTQIAGGSPGQGGGTADGVPALDYRFDLVGGILRASNGDLIVRDLNRIMRISADGIIRVMVGNGGGTFVDGAPALQTGLGFPNYLATNAAGDLFIADGVWGLLVVRAGVIRRLSTGIANGLTSSAGGVFFSRDDRVFRLMPDDSVQPIAGVDRSAWYGPGRPVNQSLIRPPLKMLTDSKNRLYYFDASFATTVMRTTVDGKIEIVAGGGGQPADDGVPALEANLRAIGDIALDGQDRLYLSVGVNSNRPSMILRVESNGTLTVVAGEGLVSQPEFFNGQNVIDTDFLARIPLIAVAPDGTLLFQIRSSAFQVKPGGIMSRAPGVEGGFLAFDPQGRLLTASSRFRVYTNLSAAPLEPFGGFARQGASAANGTYFFLSGFTSVIRRTAQGRTTDLLNFAGGFRFENGNLAPNAGLNVLSAIATNQDGDLFIAAPSLDRVFVIRGADECSLERPYVAAIVNGASFDSFSAFAPGTLVSVFGDFLGGDDLAYGAPGQSSEGTWQTSVGGLEIFVGDEPAPIIFSRADQAAFVIPNQAGPSMTMRFRRDGLEFGQGYTVNRTASPGIFTVDSSGSGQAAALNQDGSINGPSNPAAAGSVIVLYLTGAGATNPPSITGSLNDFPLPQLVEPVHVSIDSKDAVVEFAGPAPGLVSGVVQVNARIPAGTPSGNVWVSVNVGEEPSSLGPSGEPVTISIQ